MTDRLSAVGLNWDAVTGSAWMDHQWGDFATNQDGGWDWFALQLDDGTDVVLYRPTTGVIYREGQACVAVVQHGEPNTGLGYVELTAYAPYVPLNPATPET